MAEKTVRSGKLKLPAKTKMNLYYKENTSGGLKRIIPAIVILVIAVVVIGKFGVIDRLNAVNKIEDECIESEAKLSSIKAQLSDYSEVRENYRRYTKNYLTATEMSLSDRLEIIKLIESTTKNLGTVESIAIVENSVSIKVNSPDLDKIAAVRRNLEESDWVMSVAVNMASRPEPENSEETVPVVSAAIVFEVIPATELEEASK